MPSAMVWGLRQPSRPPSRPIAPDQWPSRPSPKGSRPWRVAVGRPKEHVASGDPAAERVAGCQCRLYSERQRSLTRGLLRRTGAMNVAHRTSPPRSRARPSTAAPRGTPAPRSVSRAASVSRRRSAGARPSAPPPRRCCAASNASDSSSSRPWWPTTSPDYRSCSPPKAEAIPLQARYGILDGTRLQPNDHFSSLLKVIVPYFLYGAA